MSDTDRPSGSSHGSSADSAYSSVHLGRGSFRDSIDSDTNSDSDSSSELNVRNLAAPSSISSQTGMSHKERLDRLSVLSSDLLADD